MRSCKREESSFFKFLFPRNGLAWNGHAGGGHLRCIGGGTRSEAEGVEREDAPGKRRSEGLEKK